VTSTRDSTAGIADWVFAGTGEHFDENRSGYGCCVHKPRSRRYFWIEGSDGDSNGDQRCDDSQHAEPRMDGREIPLGKDCLPWQGNEDEAHRF
jgi:hypothetical protein